MANTISSLKRVRQAKARTHVNRLRKTRLRHQVRAMRRALAANELTKAQELMPKTFSLIDRSAKWGLIKKNTAARYKSRITLRIRKISTTATA